MIIKKMNKDNYIRHYIHYKEDQKSSLAKQVEFITVLFILWLITAFYMLSVWGHGLTVMAVTFLLLLGEYKLANQIKQKKIKHNIDRYKIWLTGTKCIESIDQISTDGEFKNLVHEILVDTTIFSKVKVNRSKVKTHAIDLTARYNNLPIAIRCEKTATPENKLPVQCLHEMVDDLEKLGLRNGIIVTNGTFSNKTRTAAEKYKKDYAITLIDRYNLVEYARKAKHKIFPAPHVIEQLVTERQEQKNGDLIPLKNRLIGDRHKATGYFTAAFILGFMYYLVNSISSFFSIIYLVFAVINIILGIICILQGKSKYDFATINIIDTGKEPG